MVVIILPFLVACSSNKDKPKPDESAKTEESKAEDKEAQKEKPKMALPICPQAAIVRELETVRDYARNETAPDQLVAAAHLKSITGDCAYRDDGIDVAFTVQVVAQRGPRLGGRRDSFSYFVAVVDPDGEVLNKEMMSTEFKFPDADADDAREPVLREESLHSFIYLPKKSRQAGPNYQILVGFQLTPEQLAAVRGRDPKLTE
jgi:hypothetical protein